MTFSVTEDWSTLDAMMEGKVVAADVYRLVGGAIYLLAKRDGTVSAATLRPYLLDVVGVPADVLNKRMAWVLSTLSSKGILQWTGDYVASNNFASRNGSRPVKLYEVENGQRLLDWIQQYAVGGDDQ